MRTYYFKKERYPYHLTTEFIDCTNWRDGFIIYWKPKDQAVLTFNCIPKYIKENLKEIFCSIQFLRTYTEEYDAINTEFFFFDDKDDEAFFILWSNDGVEI